MHKQLLKVAVGYGVTGIVAAVLSGSLLPIAAVICASLLTACAARHLHGDD
jgi:hypothetical protein